MGARRRRRCISSTIGSVVGTGSGFHGGPCSQRGVAVRGPGSAGALAGMDLGASLDSRHDATHVEPRGAQANRAHLNFVMP